MPLEMNAIRNTMVTMWERVFNDGTFVFQRPYQYQKTVLQGNNIHFKRKMSVFHGTQLIASMHPLYYTGCSLPNYKTTTFPSVSIASFIILSQMSFPFPFISPNLTLRSESFTDHSPSSFPNSTYLQHLQIVLIALTI